MNKIRKIIILTIFCLIMISGYSVVNAASASISSNKTSINVGETANITVSVNAAAWNLHVTGPISKSYADVTDDGENTKKNMALSFKPSKEGTYTIKLSGDISDGSDGTPKNVSDSVTIKVSKQENNDDSEDSSSSSSSESSSSKKSSVATLKNLGITPKQYDFSNFKSGTTSYNIKVPSDVDTIKIYATATDKNATISGTGSKKLKDGKNTFTVKVTAEDKKTTKKYTLVITKETEKTEKNETTPETTSQDEETVETTNLEENSETAVITKGLTELNINSFELDPKFSNDVYEYKVNITDDISKLDIQAKPADDNMKIEIVGNENFKEGENVVTILVYNPSDDTTTTYQVIANKGNSSGIDLSEMNKAIDEAKKTQLKFNLILGVTVGIIIILIIIFLIGRYRIQKKQEDDIENISTLEFDEQNEEENNVKNKPKGKRFK